MNPTKLSDKDYNLLMGYVHDYRMEHNLGCLQDQSVDFAAFVLLKLHEMLSTEN
jgi:hypothetical protein